MDESQQQIDDLKQAYRDDDGVRQILDAFATYQNSMRTVNVDVIWNKVGRQNIKRSKVVAALKRLQELNFGTYTKGAHQYPSRFGFPRSKGPLWVALLAQGSEEEDLPDDTSDLTLEDETFDAGNDGNLIVHKLRLREDTEVAFSLPKNLTPIEAKRLCLWIKSIPLSGDGEEY